MLGKPKIFGLGFIGAGLVTVGFLYLPDYFAGRRVDRLYAELTEQAKGIVKDGLSDPYSAQFEDVRVVGDAPHLMVCGFVNAKNKLGGYVGRKPFIVSETGKPYIIRNLLDQITMPEGIVKPCFPTLHMPAE